MAKNLAKIIGTCLIGLSALGTLSYGAETKESESNTIRSRGVYLTKEARDSEMTFYYALAGVAGLFFAASTALRVWGNIEMKKHDKEFEKRLALARSLPCIKSYTPAGSSVRENGSERDYNKDDVGCGGPGGSRY